MFFVFNDAAFEHSNVITDFEDGIDIIRVSGNSGFEAIQITALNDGADTQIVQIVLSGGTAVILKDVASAVIDICDF